MLHSDGVAVNPTELAAAASPGPLTIALAGADHFRHHDVMRATLRRHLEDVARLTCRLRPATAVTARLEERVRTVDELRVSEVTVRCEH